MKENNFVPCTYFKTSCSDTASKVSSETNKVAESSRCDIFENMSSEIDSAYFDSETLKHVSEYVGVTLEDSVRIEKETQGQGLFQAWYYKQSK